MKVLKTSLTLLLGLLLMLPAYTGALAGETQQQLTSESVIETIKKRGKLMVGMSTFVPWAMRNKQGDLIGFEIDVAKKVAEDMGVDIEFDASTNVLAIPLPADSTGDEYYDLFTGIPNNAGSGVTGDIDFTTVGHSNGDAYSIILVLNKNY